MKFKVIEDTWLHGPFPEGTNTSVLLNGKGDRCCMGFLAQQCGIPDEALLDLPDFSHLERVHWEKLPEPFKPIGRWTEQTKAVFIYDENDKGDKNLEERKSRLRVMFDDVGIEVEFVKFVKEADGG